MTCLGFLDHLNVDLIQDTVHSLMEGGMKNATARGKLTLPLPIVGTDLKDQQWPQLTKVEIRA